MREVSAVVFDVDIESSEHSDPDVMDRLFSQSPAIHLRTTSPITYQSGDYEQTIDSPTVFTGRLDRIRTDPLSQVVTEGGRFRFIDAPTSVQTSTSSTYFAFVPHAKLLVYRDTAEMPHTRISSYVDVALELARSEGFSAHCVLTARMTSRPLREWLDHFSSIDHIRLEFRHSQSPGNKAIDTILERLNANTMMQSATASADKALSKSALLDDTQPIGQAIDHLDQSIKNGSAEIAGHVGGVRTKFNTRRPVERHIVSVEEDVSRMRSGLAKFALRLSLALQKNVSQEASL